ncbi:catalase-related peroxidase [Lentzea sp. NBRC 105346]|uniref:catalase n=1 Tax=Lentzea sp. NBRC 105346 TaxID=3032205 RepID=UPI00249FAEEB|nr:catalase [Lentzea sp. NBRC 105346]GLZ33783.1 catalase-related peroxidase [Lentzea sp. NBRC 105346]
MTPEESIDRIEAAGRPRPQDRRLHARGAVYDGKFVPSGHIKTVAAHLTTETDVVVRFSNGSPKFRSDDRTKGIRGMAVKFLRDGKAVHDLVAANFRAFPSRDAEGFIELVEALTALAGKDKAKGLGRLAKLLVKHPESRATLKAFAGRDAPASFATTRFDGLHAFYLLDAEGKRRAFRYRLVPQLGEVDLDPKHAKTLDANFLIPQLDHLLTTGPVIFTLAFQFAEPGDPTHDPSRAWPEHRTLLPAGQFVITGRTADEEKWQRSVFDPTRLAEGVELSDDPVLRFRPGAYSISAERRLSAQQ